MNQQDFFADAQWVGMPNCEPSTFFVLRGSFDIDTAEKVSLNILGMGLFKCYINGICINPDTFLPLCSEYDSNIDSKKEVLSGHRIYVPQFDITPFVKRGRNTIAVHFGGGGWYAYNKRLRRYPKAIYCITAEGIGKTEHFVSNEECRIKKSFIDKYSFCTDYTSGDELMYKEKHNYIECEDYFSEYYDDSNWEHAVTVDGFETEYCRTDCPADKLIERLPVKKIGQGVNGTVYDCGRNTTGYPVLEINAAEGETVTVTFSEELTSDGKLDETHMHEQSFAVVSDGAKRTVQPEFMWYGFRYFEVCGNAEVKCVKEIYADIPFSSSFRCDNETLNWIYDTFAHTMHTNMHMGIPSDCPHIERRGYTGDGQLTCNAVLSMFDAKAFYEKWLRDIADGQDALTGHIQYTAPFVCSGGGPGGWGSAIVEVPYRLYRHFGEKKILEEYYENMRKYIDFLEAHSEFGLVTSDVKGAWCLGDWCGPNILYPDSDITFFDQQIFIPAPFVNTYFMVKSLKQMCEIAEVIGRTEDIDAYKEKIETRTSAIRAAYFNTFDGNFFMNAQGANAFAVDLGIGSEKTYKNMVDYYKKIGCLDTGIFATDILIRTLFEHGDGELAVKLLSQGGKQGFETWRRNGATTFHEYWDSNRSRSHNHPMFGAVTAYMLEYLLGIKQKDGSAGYVSTVIEPSAVSEFSEMSGSMMTAAGKIAVSYKKENSKIKFEITIPEGTEAVFKFNGKTMPLAHGENVIETEYK